MIKANELRIRNWVIFCSQSYIVLSIDEEFVKLETDYNGFIEVFINEIKPIALTEEILLKAGFEKKISILGNFEIKHIDYRFVQFVCFLLPDNRLEVEFFAKHNNVDERGYLTTIKYLHQLQNLVHSLTEQELEIKL